MRKRLAMALAAGALVAAMVPGVAAAGQDRPFHASYSAILVGVPNVPPAQGTGAGRARHMGAISTLNLINFSGSSSCDQGEVPVTDVTTLIAANGDTLTILATECWGGGAVSGIWSLVGGTGRFAGATGSGSLSGSSDAASYSVDLVGVIDY